MWAQDGGEDTNYTPSFSETEVIRVSGNRASAIVPAEDAGDNDHWYFVTQNRVFQDDSHGDSTPIYDENGSIKRAALPNTPATFNGQLVTEKADYLVRFFKKSDDVYYMQFANGNFIKDYDNPGNDAELKTTSDFNSAGLYALYILDSGSSFGWNLHEKEGKRVDNKGDGHTVVFWGAGKGSTGGNAEWFIYPVTFEEPLSVTYHAIYNGGDKKQEQIKVLSSSAPSCPTSFLDEFVKPEGFYSDAACQTKITEITEDTHDIYVKMESPVKFSESFGDAVWYYLNLRTSKQLYYPGESAGKAIDSYESATTGDDVKWALIGNPYDGVKVINKVAGAEQYLTHSEGNKLSWNTEGNATTWRILTHPYDSNGFMLRHQVSETSYTTIYYGNNEAGIIALTGPVTATNDNMKGGCFDFTEVPEDYSNMVAEKITPYFESNVLNIYFGLTTDKANELKDTYTYWDGETVCSEDEYTDLYEAVMAAIVYPKDGDYYRIKNYGTQRYLGKEANNQATFESGEGASTIGYLTKADDGYSLSLQGATAYPSLTINVVAPGLATMKNNNSNNSVYAFLRNDANGGLREWSAESLENTPGAYWSVEDAESITVSLNSIEGDDNYYATLCVPFALTDGNGIAHTISVEGMEANLTSTGGTIEAGLPVLLMGSESTATFSIVPGTPAVAPASSGLTGTFIAKTIDGAADYVLGTYGGRVGFFHWASSNLAANRAYIAASTLSSGNGTSEVKGFYLNFDEMTDGVAAVEEATTEAPAIYNLAGQRVAKAVKGIYVVNGKKMWVK